VFCLASTRGQTVKVDGDELLVMKEDDLFAVVEK
jgi:chaperonin GroES